jgi:hypothetical protein
MEPGRCDGNRFDFFTSVGQKFVPQVFFLYLFENRSYLNHILRAEIDIKQAKQKMEDDYD